MYQVQWSEGGVLRSFLVEDEGEAYASKREFIALTRGANYIDAHSVKVVKLKSAGVCEDLTDPCVGVNGGYAYPTVPVIGQCEEQAPYRPAGGIPRYWCWSPPPGYQY